MPSTTGYTPPALDTGPVATHYAYNLDKQPTRVTRPDGQTIDYAYDSFGRLSGLATPDGAITYGYKAGSGQLASIAAPGNINLAYTYDGALPTKTTVTGPVPGTLTTVYDNFFRPSQIGVNGSNVAYAYDADGLLTGAGSMTLARDPGNGMVTGTALGQIATTQGYDSFGQVSGFTAKQGTTVLFDEQYQRDNAGRLTGKTVTMNGQTSVYGYAYDTAGRLVDATRDGIATGHYEYDANGNRTLAYGIASSYDDQDRLIAFGNAQYFHTANGELGQVTSGSGTTMFGYDVSGNLLHVALPDGKTLDYLVDGRNRRIGKKVNGALVQGFLYQDQLKPAAELDAQGNVVSRFVYAGKANVPEYMVKGGATYRIVTDQLGSVWLVVSSTTGQIAQRIDYDEWGNVLSDSNPGFQPFGFAGGLYDRDTGLVRFGARGYDPKTGRWTAKDPVGFKGGDASLYNYAGGDPVNFKDPKGRIAVPVGIGIGTGIAIGIASPQGQKILRDIAKGIADTADKVRDIIFSENENSDAADEPVVYPDNPDSAPEISSQLKEPQGSSAPVMVRFGSEINQATEGINGNVGTIKNLGEKENLRLAFGLMVVLGNSGADIVMTFNFSDLLAKALLDWPDEIDLSPLMRSGNDPMRYSIQGLGQMSDSITERYIGTSEEVMLRNLHEAIYEVLHGAAAYTTRIRMSELRSEAIRSKFEKRLQNAMQIPELDYNPEDIQLIQKYFERNQ